MGEYPRYNCKVFNLVDETGIGNFFITVLSHIIMASRKNSGVHQMSLSYEIITIGLILSVDSFSAAVAMGLRPFTRKDVIKFALSSGIAEAGVALIGSLAGSYIISRFSAIDHWIAFTLLGAVALHMGYEGVIHLVNKNKDEEKKGEAKTDFHSFGKIILVSLATSLDAFGVGIGLGIANKPIIPFIISIGAWAFISTIVGMYLARKLSAKFGPVMNLVGAVVLGFMAFQMLKI
jgi:putative Mn2+ efflux pump MntP